MRRRRGPGAVARRSTGTANADVDALLGLDLVDPTANHAGVDLRARLGDPGPRWQSQSRSFRGFPGMPDDMNGWFRFDGTPDDMHGAIEELRKRMEELERRLGQQQAQPKLPGGTEKI